MKRLPYAAASAVVSATLWPAAHAAEGPDSPTSPATEELVVTVLPLTDILQPTQILGREELLIKNTPTLGETLANEPGINSTYFGPASSRPVIRGLAGPRVIMLTDSSTTGDVADVSPDHAVPVEPLLADQVEILRGPAALLYGSTAAGGLVNVLDGRVPKQVAEEPVSGAVEVRGDTAAEERAIVGRLDGGVGAFAWHIDGFTRETENLEIPGFATADPAERPADEPRGELRNSYSETDGFAGGLSWVGERGYLGASVSVYESTYGLPGPAEEEGGPPPLTPDPFEGPFIDLQQVRTDVRGEYRFDGTALESARLVLGLNNYEHQEIEPSGEVATDFDNEQWQLRLEAVHRPLAGFKGVFGVQLDDRDFSAVGEEAFVSPTQTDAVGLFLVEEAEYDWGKLQAGARVESLDHDNDTFADYSDEAWSFSLGAAINVGWESQLIANLSRTERNPNTEELYSNGAHLATQQFEVGLIADGGSARKEVATNIELGWERRQGDVTWQISGFYYDFSDYIYQDLTGNVVDDLPEAIYRQEGAEFYGAEAAVTVPLWARGAFTSDVRLFGDLVRAELDSGEKLPRIPPWRTGANFGFGALSWRGTFDVIYNAEQDDITSFNTDAFTMVNASFTYLVTAGPSEWELFVKGTNLADEDARRSTSFLAAFAPLPGRSWHAGARVAF